MAELALKYLGLAATSQVGQHLREANNNKHPGGIHTGNILTLLAVLVEVVEVVGVMRTIINLEILLRPLPPPPRPHSLQARHLLTLDGAKIMSVRPIRANPLSQAQHHTTNGRHTCFPHWDRMGRNVKICPGTGWQC